MINYNTSINYKTTRLDIIKYLEGGHGYVHDDGRGIPTIGYGANLKEENVLKTVLAVGFDIDFEDPVIEQKELNLKLLADMKDAISVNSDLETLKKELNRIWQDYKGIDSVLFELGEGKIVSLFEALAPDYEDEINKWLAGIPESQERVVLFSLAYNTPVGESSLLGPSLRKAIQSGNRARAWVEIRYRSNKISKPDVLPHGLASRRYYEAQLFGL